MFIFENYLESRRRKIAEWNKARDKWISEGSYRYDRDYHKVKPYPVVQWGRIARTVIPVAIAVHVALLGVFWLFHTNQQIDKPKTPEKPVTYNIGDKCSKYHIGDIAYIKYGDFEGAEVEIVGGCRNNEDYKVKVTKDQTLFGKGSENENYNDKDIKKDFTFEVRSNDNLTITGKASKKE